MVKLAEELLTAIEGFVFLAEQAPEHLTARAEERKWPTAQKLEKWQEQTEKAKKYHKQLVVEMQNVPENKEAVDSKLGFFRSLPKAMDYIGCSWSAYHARIEQSLEKVIILIEQIDEKYKMGWEKYS